MIETLSILRYALVGSLLSRAITLTSGQILRPISRLGGITYGRVLDGIELPRPDWNEFEKDAESRGLVKPKRDDQ